MPVTITGQIPVGSLQEANLDQMQVDNTESVDYSQLIEVSTVPASSVPVPVNPEVLSQPLHNVQELHGMQQHVSQPAAQTTNVRQSPMNNVTIQNPQASNQQLRFRTPQVSTCPRPFQVQHIQSVPTQQHANPHPQNFNTLRPVNPNSVTSLHSLPAKVPKISSPQVPLEQMSSSTGQKVFKIVDSSGKIRYFTSKVPEQSACEELQNISTPTNDVTMSSTSELNKTVGNSSGSPNASRVEVM